MIPRNIDIFAAVILSVSLCAGCSSGGSSSGGRAAAASMTGGLQGHSGAVADMTGDGIEDLLVAAPYAKTAAGTGAVIVYAGSANGFSSTPATVLTGQGNFGYAVADLGDVTGDGIADVAVSSLNGSGSDVSLSGTVTVFKGGKNGEALITLAGDDAMDKFGAALVAADVDGDGVRELVIGAPFNTPKGRPDLYQGGAVYLYDFRDNTVEKLAASSTLKGLGWKLSRGDMNGDGTDDLAVGVAGKVAVFYGGGSFDLQGEPDVVVSSALSGFGSEAAFAGDVNGDGFDDLAVSAIYSYGSGSNTLFLVAGAPGPRSVTVTAASGLPDILTRIAGEYPLDAFGTTVVPLGDIDDDGKDDFAVSAVHADAGAFKAGGKVYLFRGKDLVSPATPISAASLFAAPAPHVHYGRFMLPFYKNGYRLLIGAPTQDANLGSVYAVSTDGGAPIFQTSLEGTTTTDDSCCSAAKGGN